MWDAAAGIGRAGSACEMARRPLAAADAPAVGNLPGGLAASGPAAGEGNPPANPKVRLRHERRHAYSHAKAGVESADTVQTSLQDLPNLQQDCMTLLIGVLALAIPLPVRRQRLCQCVNCAEACRDGQLCEKQGAQHAVAGALLHGLANEGIPDAWSRRQPC